MLGHSHLQHSHIMVVDDEPVNLHLATSVLKSEGYQNVTALQDPTLLMGMLEAVDVDLLLLDLNMPVLSGFDLLEQLQQFDPDRVPSVMVLTAQTSHDYRLKALQLGALEFLSKPFDRLELLVRVRNMLQIEAYKKQLKHQNQHLEEQVEARTRALKATQLKVVQRLGTAAEYRDNETGMHIVRMSQMAKLLAEQIGLDREQSELILHASPMHDVGKIGIPDHILHKPGKHTPEEWAVMQRHTVIGAEILSGDDSELLQLARTIALSHHEKWDGSGYPHGLQGEAIPIAARICGVADVFDALTSDRPYKKAWSVEDARALILDGCGSHFDPALVAAFERVYPQFCELRMEYRDD